MGCTSSTPSTADATTNAAGRKHSRAPSFHAIGHAESRRDSSTADGESPAERRRRLRAERRTTTPAQRMNGKPPLASSAHNNNTNTNTTNNNNASSAAIATKSHGASGSNSQSNFLSFSASRNPLTHPATDDDDDLASAASSSAGHALPRTEVRQEHTPTAASQQLQHHQQEQRQLSNTSPSQSLSASRRHVRDNAQGSDDNYVPTSPAAAAVRGDGGTSCRHAAPHHEPVVQSLPATPASLRYSSPHPSPAPNRTLGDLPGQPHRPPPVTRQASSGRSFLTVSGFFSTSDGAALSGS